MSDIEEEGELDPAMERVRRKLVRLLFVSTGIMVLGLAAVVAGIFYRVSQMDDADDEPVSVAIDVEAGDVREATVADDNLVLTIVGKTPRIEVRRLSDGALVGTYLLGTAKDQGR
ncbi:MAG: hypothetical protein AAGB11_07515 [Pseudomonadota bacterium]